MNNIMLVSSVSTSRGQKIKVETNEDNTEMWNNPWLTAAQLRDYPKDKLQLGMAKEMKSMDAFKVYYEVDANDLSPAQNKAVIGTRWVLRWKGDEVRCRLVAQGYSQELDNVWHFFKPTW